MNRTLLALAVFAGLTGSAYAGTSTANMSVSATVTGSCTISAGELAFGNYDAVGGTAVDGSASLTVACTQGTVSTITLDQGANPATGSADATPLRQMSNGTANLGYTLYQDSAHLTVWGNTAATGVGYTAASSASSDVSVYGTISASQDVPEGSYTDTVVATITF